ncbi:MAG TPA: porin [Cytophagaceae bacterium]
MLKIWRAISLVILMAVSFSVSAQEEESVIIVKEEEKKPWYEVLSLGGYVQVRYNRLFESNGQLKCDQCDKSIGENGGIFIRRARIKISGDISPRVFLYLQTDVASNAMSNGSTPGLHYLQLRDLYGDIFLDKGKAFKLRVGLSKVPYGFDNLQSSQNRIAFDRTDAINSAAINERDQGAFLYWTPAVARQRFKDIMKSGLKGTGDYGLLGFGVANGQTANRTELNDDLNVYFRVTYPFLLTNGQYIEAGANAYSGVINVSEFNRTGIHYSRSSYADRRVGGYVVVYPQPFGIQAEYNFGEGPEFDYDAHTGVKAIKSQNLHGGYVQLMYKMNYKQGIIFPYARVQYYEGGKKLETDARSYIVKELEAGVEWEIIPSLEVTTAYVLSDRTFEDSARPENNQKGGFLRLQVQFNY